MPKYRDKMRLNDLLLKNSEVDSLTRYLILSGYPDDVVKAGLESFVAAWEESAKWIRCDFPLVSDEYYYDLFQRSQLYLVLQHASPMQIAAYSTRIDQADHIFKQHTIEIDAPCDAFIDDIKKSEKEIHWWLFRLPKKGLS